MVLEMEVEGREERLWGGRDSCKEGVLFTFIIVCSADLEEDCDEDNIKD